jgi:hypothetical protein
MHYNKRTMTAAFLPACQIEKPAPDRCVKSAGCAQNHKARKGRETGAKRARKMASCDYKINNINMLKY